MIVLSLFLAAQLSAATIPLVNLDSLETRYARGADTTYVVNFWATWCKPCVAELAAFDKLNRTTFDKPVKVLLVSLDNPSLVEKVAEFITKKGYSTEVLVLNEKKPHLWIDRVSEQWSGAIPATMLLNADSKLKRFYEREFTTEQIANELQTFLDALP